MPPHVDNLRLKRDSELFNLLQAGSYLKKVEARVPLSIAPVMLRLRDDQWAQIREHFPEEHIPDSCPGANPSPHGLS